MHRFTYLHCCICVDMQKGGIRQCKCQLTGVLHVPVQMIDMDLNDDTEKKVVEGVFWNAVDILSEQDRRLPHIHAILPMLKRGVGVHHSGLLPILKEVIEILFQEGLIKVGPQCRHLLY